MEEKREANKLSRSRNRSKKSQKRKASKIKNLFEGEDKDSDRLKSSIPRGIAEGEEGIPNNESSEESLTDVDEEDEALGFAFLGLDRKLLAQECPNLESIKFAKDAMKRALEDNEMEEGASRIVMEEVGESSTVTTASGSQDTQSSNESKKESEGENGSNSRQSSSKMANQLKGDTIRDKKRRMSNAETKKLKYLAIKKTWEDFMNERIKQKLMSRIDELNEKNPIYKMLLRDEKANDDRMLVTVELMKYLNWLKVKLQTHRSEFYFSQTQPKVKKEAESTIRNPGSEKNPPKKTNPASSNSRTSRKSRTNVSKSVTPTRSIRVSPGGEFKTPSPKKKRRERKASERSEASSLGDFYSMLQTLTESSPEKSPPKRLTPQSKKSASASEQEQPEHVLGVSLNTSRNSPTKNLQASSSFCTQHAGVAGSSKAVQSPLDSVSAKKQFEQLNLELEELINAHKKVAESDEPLDFFSMLNDDVPDGDGWF